MLENNITEQLANLQKSVVCSEKSSVEVSKCQTDEIELPTKNNEKNNDRPQNGHLKNNVKNNAKNGEKNGAEVSKCQTDGIDKPHSNNSEENSARPQNGHFMKNTEKNTVSVPKYQTNEIGLPTKNSGKNSGIKNLKPFPKGKSGNPKGRPVGSRNYDTIRKEALIQLGKEQGLTPEQIEVLLVSKGITQALKGDYRFYKDDLDRRHGQPTHTLVHSVDENAPLHITIDV